VFDAFIEDVQDKSVANYFGSLTSIGEVAAGASATFTPIHGPISTYIVYDGNNDPVKRVFTLGAEPQTFEVDQSDIDIISATKSFIQSMEKNPDDPAIKQFKDLIQGGKASASKITDYFKNSSDYKSCTYMSYMLVVVALARTPDTSGRPANEQRYSLSTLLKYMGIDWPDGFPDIAISEFHCSDSDDRITLGGKLNIRDVTFKDGVMDHVRSILPSETIVFKVVFDYGVGLGAGSTTLVCVFDNIKIPVGGGHAISLDKPTVMLSVTPLFKFVVFEIKASIPFSLFGSPTFIAETAMTIDNVEAEIGLTIDGDGHTLLTPPGIKGLHFDEFGAGMGLFFEPPGYALGVEGKFHIGDGANVVQLDDDTFAVVCELEGDVPNPLYIAFYVPKMDLVQVLAIFTNQSINIDFPVSLSDLSFRWSENPMEPVVLPDGTLTRPGYGFTAFLDLFGIDLYCDAQLDLNNGIEGRLSMAPFSLGPVMSLTGEGREVRIKVDASGNPIPNNTIPRTAAAKQAIDQAATKQLVAPGGPEMRISTSDSPYFKLDGRLSFLGFHDRVLALIDRNGISFELDYGGIISSRMAVTLKDYHNLSASFSYGPDYDIPLPSLAGISLGHIRLRTQIDVALALTTSTSDIGFSASGGFDFVGLDCKIGPFDLDIHIAELSDVLAAIESWLVDNAEKLFGSILGDAEKWAKAVYSNVILPAVQGAEYVVNVLKNGFGKTIDEVGDLLKGSEYALNDVAKALKDTFEAPANDVAKALNTAFQQPAQMVGIALQAAGYGVNDVASALQSTFSFTADTTATVLRQIGYTAQQTTQALGYVFTGLAPSAINTILQGAGYAANEVEDAFKAIGGAFSDFAQDAWDQATHYINPSNW
jgi:hypothetical protein